MKVNFNNSPSFKSLYISDDLSKNWTNEEKSVILRIAPQCKSLSDHFLSKCAVIDGGMKEAYRLENIGTVPGIGTSVRSVYFLDSLKKLKEYFEC